MACEHKYIHYDTNKQKQSRIGYPQDYYKRVDLFYCEKCLDYTEKVREEHCIYKPDWY